MVFYFPTYLATGNAFCNRTDELKRLIYDLKNSIPVLLMSPRRYGKTSLAMRAIEQLQYPYADIDLFKACDEHDIAKIILTGIGQLLGQIESSPKKLLAIAADFFNTLSINVSLVHAGIALDFSKKEIKPIDTVLNALKKLQTLAAKKNKKVILFLDEFQAVSEVTKNYALEAVLREVAQKSKNLLFIFSGSNRHLMEKMFFDKKRPLYKLCDLIVLDRIEAVHYIRHIQNAAKHEWKTELSDSAIQEILKLSELHPYYVNKLCSLLWQNDKPPSEKSINETWKRFVLENKSVTERELLLLTPLRRKLLIIFSENANIKGIYAKDSLTMVGLSLGGIQKSIKHLTQMYYVYVDQDGCYKILDPLIKNVLILEKE